MKQRTSRIVIIISLCLFCVAVVEIISRIIFPVAEVCNFNRILYSPLCGSFQRNHGGIEKYWLANTSFIWNSFPDKASFVHHLNLYGFRDKDWLVRKARQRIMFVGDSFVEGFMSSDDATIPAGFAAESEKHGYNFEVMNMGIGGAGPLEYVKLIRDAVPIFHPDHVIVVFYANDFPAPPISPRFIEERLTPCYRNAWIPRLALVSGRLLNRLPVPLRWRRGRFKFIPSIPDPANPLSNRVDSMNGVRPEILRAMERGDFNPYVINCLISYEMRLRKFDPNMETYVKFIAHWCRVNETRAALVYIPCPYVLSKRYAAYAQAFSKYADLAKRPDLRVHARQLEQISQLYDVPFLDLTDALSEVESRGQWMFNKYDEHMNPHGYLMVGKLIFSKLFIMKSLEN